MLLPSFVLCAFTRSTSRRLLTTAAYENLTNPTSTITRYFNLTPSFLAHTPAKYTHHDLLLFPEFLSEPEHDFLVSACDRKLKRSLGSAAQYEQGHFDGVIRGYRECEASYWGKDDARVREILQRVFGLLPEEWEWLNPHILDLEAKGEILAHMDNADVSVFLLICVASIVSFHTFIHLVSPSLISSSRRNCQYSGSVVAGLCLLSPAVMRLRHKADSECRFDVLLEPRALYIQRNSIRYDFTHEIPGSDGQWWQGEKIEKDRRISLIVRDKKRN
ncbi:hypothetical protein BC937DRAFT_93179 [Endogone sp. FLAS-F59071]|nr:hypothetical protein BC937DRAFT_93179 [Endogone sp. FLAS-F59071]|eukprot:RUS14896.1 hypothetical protein BC937DRAFT_93179 [Endogone sp. FLAS-F59071]